jgi:hypothetical protein
MALSWWNRVFKPKLRPTVRRPRSAGARPRVEELEARLQPAGFFFSTGLTDGRIATISEPPNAHNSQVEFESADDFVLNQETVINRASFTGLLTGGATVNDVSNVFLTIYRVFPNDSDLTRTPQVPTRTNSPADNEIDNFDSAVGDLSFTSRLLNPSFTAQKSVSSIDKISVSGGNGPATGEEVQFNVTFNATLDLPAGHYFFVPKIGLTDTAPAAADFLWLSAARPIKSPGTPFPAGATDLQSWMRSTPGIAPDWLRIGQDIVGGNPFPTFNGTFSLAGDTVPPQITSLNQNSATEGSSDLTITINGSNFTQQSTVLIDGLQPVITTFVNTNQLKAIIPAGFLAEEGQFTISVLDGQNEESNGTTFNITESVPAINASVTRGLIFQEITVSGQVTDQAIEDHIVRIDFGDGQVQELDLPAGSDGQFSVTHTFAQPGHVEHHTIVVTALDDEGTVSNLLQFDAPSDLRGAGFFFSTGLPDGKIATISEPANAHNQNVDFETADDFVLNTETVIDRASFTGLLTGGTMLQDVDNVVLEIYRVFPNDSDLTRTPQVPTRVNSPSDNAIDSFDSAVGDVTFESVLLKQSFTAQNSVSRADKIAVASGGNGQVTGEEVQFDVTFQSTLDLPAGHYFFVPKVGLKDTAPAGADFLYLSAPRPITSPGTPFAADLQSWMRSEPGIAPDWLRIGTDIIGGSTTFNGSFSLSGHTVAPQIDSLSQTSAPEGSPDLTITINGSNFTSNSTVLIDGLQPLVTTFVNTNQLTAIIPAEFLAEEGQFTISVLDGQNGESNANTFDVTESVPAINASVVQGLTFQEITLSGQVTDQALEGHRAQIDWGDGTVQEIDLGVSSSAPFSVSHTFDQPGHVQHDTITVTAVDDEGAASDPLTFDVIV